MNQTITELCRPYYMPVCKSNSFLGFHHCSSSTHIDYGLPCLQKWSSITLTCPFQDTCFSKQNKRHLQSLPLNPEKFKETLWVSHGFGVQCTIMIGLNLVGKSIVHKGISPFIGDSKAITYCPRHFFVLALKSNNIKTNMQPCFKVSNIIIKQRNDNKN